MPQQYSDNHPIDEQFRQSLKGYSVQPRKRVWNGISGNLGAGSQRVAIIRKVAVGVSLSLMAATITYFIFVPSLHTHNGITANAGKQLSVNTSSSTTRIEPDAAKPARGTMRRQKSTSGNNKESVYSTTISNSPAPAKSSFQQPVEREPVEGKNAANASAQTNSNTTAQPNNASAAAISDKLEKVDKSLRTTLHYLNNVFDNANDKAETPSSSLAFTTSSEIVPVELAPVKAVSLLANTDIAEPIQKLAITSIPDTKSVVNNASAEKPGYSPICIKGFYGGVDGSFSNTWLFDERAKSNPDFKAKLTFGHAYTIKAGYNITNWLGIETGCNIISVEGQKYSYIPPVVARIEPSNLVNRMRLNYTQVPLLIKLKSAHYSNLTHQNMVFNFAVGGEYGHLNSIVNTVNDQNFVDNNFKKGEWAAITELGYDFYFSPKIFLSTNLKATYSSNLYVFPVTQNNQFIAPHSFTGGVEIGLHYMIPACR